VCHGRFNGRLATWSATKEHRAQSCSGQPFHAAPRRTVYDELTATIEDVEPTRLPAGLSTRTPCLTATTAIRCSRRPSLLGAVQVLLLHEQLLACSLPLLPGHDWGVFIANYPPSGSGPSYKEGPVDTFRSQCRLTVDDTDHVGARPGRVARRVPTPPARPRSSRTSPDRAAPTEIVERRSV